MEMSEEHIRELKESIPINALKFFTRVMSENPPSTYLEFWLQLSYLSRASAREPLVF